VRTSIETKITDKLTVYQVLHRLKLRQELIRNEFTQVWRIPFAQMLTTQTSSPIPHLRQFDALAKALDMEIGNVLDIAMKCLVRDLRDVVTKECTYGRCPKMMAP
jgi:hypothetical protein